MIKTNTYSGRFFDKAIEKLQMRRTIDGVMSGFFAKYRFTLERHKYESAEMYVYVFTVITPFNVFRVTRNSFNKDMLAVCRQFVHEIELKPGAHRMRIKRQWVEKGSECGYDRL